MTTETNNTEQTPHTYYIPECNIEQLKKELTRLAKRAQKLNVEPISFTVGNAIQAPVFWDSVDLMLKPWLEVRQGPMPADKTGAVREYWTYYPVTVDGKAPVLNGWTFVAVVQRIEMEEGPAVGILRLVGSDIPVPVEFRDQYEQCWHCKKPRPRKDVYVVYHREEQRYSVVGSSCLKDFLGHLSPHAYADLAEQMATIGELCAGAEDEGYFGCGGRSSAFDVNSVLQAAAAAIRKDGYYSKTKAKQNDEPHRATANTVMCILTTRPSDKDYKEITERYSTTQEDIDLAASAREWARSLTERENNDEYLYTLSVLARAASIEPRNVGYATSMLVAYNRDLSKRVERESTYGNSKHIGEVGKKARFTATLMRATPTEGFRGDRSTVMTFRSKDGDMVTWFKSGDEGGYELGKEYNLIGTVKSHGEFKGTKQTVVKLVKEDEDPTQPLKQTKPASVGKSADGVRLYKGDTVTLKLAQMPGHYGYLSTKQMEELAGQYTVQTYKGTIVGASKPYIKVEYVKDGVPMTHMFWPAVIYAKAEESTPTAEAA